MKKYIIISWIITFAAIALFASQTIVDAQKNRAIKRQKVIQLLKITRAPAQAASMMNNMTELLPPDVRGALRNSININTMVSKVIPVYEKHLTVHEIDAMIAFYKTRTGQQILAKQPLIMRDSMIVMKVYMQDQLEKNAGLK